MSERRRSHSPLEAQSAFASSITSDKVCHAQARASLSVQWGWVLQTQADERRVFEAEEESRQRVEAGLRGGRWG